MLYVDSDVPSSGNSGDDEREEEKHNDFQSCSH